MNSILIPVFGPYYFDINKYRWPIEYPEGHSLVELNGDISDGTIGLLVSTLLEYSHMELNKDFISALMATEVLALNGGLRITKEGKTIDPSCCADFQDWREWELLIAGDIDALWLGHNPSPWVEVVGDSVVVWSDQKENQEAFTISLSKTEIEVSLQQVEKDLVLVSERISNWASNQIKPMYPDFVNAMRHYLLKK